eukprot:303701_1
MAASSNRNESYIIKDLMMTLMTWYSSFLYQIIMDSPQQLARTTFSLHNHGTDHNHQETQHTSTTQYTISIHQTHPIITGYDSTVHDLSYPPIASAYDETFPIYQFSRTESDDDYHISPSSDIAPFSMSFAGDCNTETQISCYVCCHSQLLSISLRGGRRILSLNHDSGIFHSHLHLNRTDDILVLLLSGDPFGSHEKYPNRPTTPFSLRFQSFYHCLFAIRNFWKFICLYGLNLHRTHDIKNNRCRCH